MANTPLDIPALIKRIPLFSELAAADLERVGRFTRERNIARGEVLFQRGDQPHGFYFVVSGQIKLAFSSPQGTEKVVEIIGSMQSFGEAVMFMNKPYPVFAEALTETALIHIGQAVVTELIDQDSTFAHKLLAGMAIRLHGLIEDVETYSLRSSIQRVIGYLLNSLPEDVEDAAALALASTGCGARPTSLKVRTLDISLPVSKATIASRLSITPEYFSRVLHDLEAEGLIRMDKRDIHIPDAARLANHTLQ